MASGRFIGIVLAATMIACAADADQVRFVGRTIADVRLQTDATQNVLYVVSPVLNCPTLERIDAETLPSNYVPPGGRHAVEPEDTVYERWTATGCGRRTDVLLAFWKAPQGGTMFRVGYPFPR